MDTPHDDELLRAQALGALLPVERERLDARAAADPELGRRVAATDAVLARFAAERALVAQVLSPATLAEHGDPVLQRLQQVAAAAGQDLRMRLLHGPSAPLVVPAPAPRFRRRAVFGVVLAAAAGLFVWLATALAGNGTPALDGNAPADLRLGARLQLVLLQPVLTATARTIVWAAVAGAAGYDAEILAGDGRVLLRREDRQRKSTAWEPTADQFTALLAHAPLRLRVTALDGAGIPIGSSGDVELSLR